MEVIATTSHMCFSIVSNLCLFAYVCVGEDVLSLDACYIDVNWKFCTKNVGIIHCKEGTTGAQVAVVAIRPALENHKLTSWVYAYCKYQGSNLKTTATVLSNGLSAELPVCCSALGVA